MIKLILYFHNNKYVGTDDVSDKIMTRAELMELAQRRLMPGSQRRADRAVVYTEADSKAEVWMVPNAIA